MTKSAKNLARPYKITILFHSIIIAYTLVALGGCGFKDDPFYTPEARQMSK